MGCWFYILRTLYTNAGKNKTTVTGFGGEEKNNSMEAEDLKKNQGIVFPSSPTKPQSSPFIGIVCRGVKGSPGTPYWSSVSPPSRLREDLDFYDGLGLRVGFVRLKS